MRARAKFQRWEEESILVPEEMEWTKKFFENRATNWLAKAVAATLPGQRAYAYKQHHMWTELRAEAERCFRSCLVRYRLP